MHIRLLFAVFVLLIVAVGCSDSATQTPIIIVVTATPAAVMTTTTPVPPTETAVPPTETAVPTLPPPSPTPVPVLSMQDTANPPGWLLSVGRVEARTRIRTLDNEVYAPSGRFWLLWLDAKNTGTADSTLESQFAFTLYDTDNKEATRAEGLTWGQISAIMKAESRDEFSANVPSGGVAHALLIFDLTSAALPQQLHVSRINKESEQSIFDLATSVQAQATAVTLAASTETAVAVAQLTAEAAKSAKANNATATAETKASNALATTEARSAKATTTALAIFTSEDQDYIDTATGWTKQYINIFGNISDLLTNWVPGDRATNRSIGVQLALLVILDKEVHDYNPPTKFSAIHAKWIEANIHWDKMAYLMADAVDKSDSSLMDEASSERIIATSFLKEVTTGLKPYLP